MQPLNELTENFAALNNQSAEPGTLYIVPTPIGNLTDMTLRAVAILSSVDVVAAEDTRHSKRLFEHFSIQAKLISLHQHNEQQRAEMLCERLKDGQSVALISDAGTPLISDPGFVMVQHCRVHGLPVIALPGPCAAITALSAAGLPTDQFHFIGFLPVKQQALKNRLEAIASAPMTTVCYEAPRRILATIEACCECLHPSQTVVLAKELTKAFERYISGSPEDVKAWLLADEKHQKGEFVVMISPSQAAHDDIPPEALTLLQALRNELPPKKAAAIVADHFGVKKNTLYAWLMENK